MFAFVYSLILLFAETAGAPGQSGGFTEFYNNYLNYPGFEAWRFINLAIFVALLVYVLRKPLSEQFKAQREAIRADLIRAEEEKQAALVQLTATEAKLAALESEKENIIRKAREEAEAEKARIIETANHEVARMQEKITSEMSRLTLQTRSELRRFSAEESIRLAEEKVKAKLNADSDSRLIKASIADIGGLN